MQGQACPRRPFTERKLKGQARPERPFIELKGRAERQASRERVPPKGSSYILPLITEEGAALLTNFPAHVLCGNPNKAGLVQLDTVKGVVCQSKPILVHKLCVAVLTCTIIIIITKITIRTITIIKMCT